MQGCAGEGAAAASPASLSGVPDSLATRDQAVAAQRRVLRLGTDSYEYLLTIVQVRATWLAETVTRQALSAIVPTPPAGVMHFQVAPAASEVTRNVNREQAGQQLAVAEDVQAHRHAAIRRQRKRLKGQVARGAIVAVECHVHAGFRLPVRQLLRLNKGCEGNLRQRGVRLQHGAACRREE